MQARSAAGHEASFIERTDRYAFYSNFWINLHHFLFQQAQRKDGEPIDGGRLLSRAEFAEINGAIDWYRDKLAQRSLLMDPYLYKVKRVLTGIEETELPTADAIDADHLAQLEAAASVYRTHYWTRHDRQNREIVAWHRDRIRALEHDVLDRISSLAQEPWPDEHIRVDLTWDANWAGAYCTVEPIHAVLTSRPGGPKNTWPPGGWLELLFHEPSHALIDPDSSTVGEILRETAEQLGLDGADQLWHAVLFLFSGTAVQEALGEEGVSHELLMVSESIFSRYQPAVNDGFAAYMAGKDTLHSAARETLEKLSAARQASP
ncbi:MAG: hypothetical protein QNJ19_17680 [Woeseiaceae bacterium]|nr:hypothetical protein [Woeseiaceae bacterium]